MAYLHYSGNRYVTFVALKSISMKSIVLLPSVLLFSIIICDAQVITPEFLWKLGRVSEPQLSPDGKEALYNVRTYSLQLNKGNSDVYKVNLETNVSTKLASDSANETSAKWSTDGKKIFYLSDKGGSNQLWSMN